MSQHTKGSWTFDKTTWRVRGGDNSVVCNVVPWDVTGCRQEDLDNGNLITASPDLYDALMMVLDDPEALDCRPRTYKVVIEALAKARGLVNNAYPYLSGEED